MIHLYLIRHGQTDWNKEGKYCGHADIPLNQTGIYQKERIIERFKKIKVDKVYSSDLKRSLHIGQAIADTHQLEVCITPALREINFGEWEGLNFDQISQQYGVEITNWEQSFKYKTGGETLPQLKIRVISFLMQVIKENKDKTLVMVNHGGPIKIMLLYALNLGLSEFWRFRIHHGAITHFIYDEDKFILDFLNDTYHLEN